MLRFIDKTVTHSHTAEMRERVLGDSDLLLSEIGLGCWQIGGNWGSIDDKTALEILDEAVEAGIRFFDTADVYGAGRSERLIGQYLKRSGESIVVATKFGRGGVYPNGYTEEALRKAVDASRERLGMDTLDLLQLHCIPFEIMRQGEVFDWLQKLKTEGAIRYYGASVETVEEAVFCCGVEGLSSLQIIFNLFRQKPVEELFPAAIENSVGLIVRLPLASGLLSGKFGSMTRFSDEDHRSFNRDGEFFNVGETFAGIRFDTGVRLANELKMIVPEDCSLAQVALRWILDYGAVSSVIPGASSPEQARQNAAAAQLPPLDSALHERLAAFYRAEVHGHIRGPY